MFLEHCTVGPWVLFSIVELIIRFTPWTTGQSCQEWRNFSWRCFSAQPCPSTICSSVVHAIQDQLYPVYPQKGELPLPYVPARVTRGAMVAHIHSAALPRCRTCQCRQCRRTFVPLSVSHWNVLSYSVFDGVGLADFKSRTTAFLLA